MRRIISWIGAMLVIGIVAVTVWVVTSLDATVARAVEHYGSEVLGTSVSVGTVEIELREGRGTMRGLEIANPEGFSSAQALRFDELTIQLVPESLLRGPLRISEIQLIDPLARVEVNARGSTNIRVLQENAASYSPSDTDPPETESGAPLRLRIDELSMEKGILMVDLRAVGDEEREATLASFRLTDLGGAEGALPGELAQEVALKLTRQVARATARQRIGAELEEEIDERLGDRPEAGAVKGLLRSLGGGSDQ